MMRRTVLGTVGLVFTQVLCSSAPTSHSQRLSRTTGASSTLIRSACRLGGGRQQQDRQRVAFPPPTLGATGAVDDDFRGRAICSIGGIICNDATEAVYIVAFADVDGQKLDGANRYTMRFEKGALPPANEFWSLTMYDPAHNLVDNPINRFAIRDRTPGVKQEADGSLKKVQ